MQIPRLRSVEKHPSGSEFPVAQAVSGDDFSRATSAKVIRALRVRVRTRSWKGTGFSRAVTNNCHTRLQPLMYDFPVL